MAERTMERASTVRPGYASRRLLAIAVLIGGTTLAACDDDPVDVNPEEEDVAGFDLRTSNGATLYSYTDPADPDTLFLDHDQTIEMRVVWLDSDGEPVALDADEHTWELEENSSGMLFSLAGPDPWAGIIVTTALQPGATVYGAFRLLMRHGADVEFQTDWLVVAVSAP